MNLLIKNANIVDAHEEFCADVLIIDGKIAEIGIELNKKDVEIIDANGLTLMPSFIDTHAHFREPGLTNKEDIESGSKAAAKGGYTGVCLMGNTNPICSSKEVVEYVRNRSKEVGLIDVHQCVSITENFAGKSIEHLNAFDNDKELVAITDDGVGVMDSSIMMKAMEKAKENNWIVMSHAEDKTFSKIDMRIAEDLMTIRDLYLAKVTGARLHMAHVSTVESINAIRRSKSEGANVTCEVTPHHIGLTTEISNYRVNPPIRKQEDIDAIIAGIKDGTVDCIGTDHAPHTEEDKQNGAPGMVGLETSFSICYTELVKKYGISINKLSELMSKNPANILGMNKGTITVGKDGDLVLVDLNKEVVIDRETFVSKGKNTPFHGRKYYGEVIATIKAGKVIYSTNV
ncbi:dihydroorotase [Clostridium celatum]|uniref:Dihydroorotase n=1 Tax=Clostridium celatum DSM 1785 TaxID=545697 RepID=L1QDV3_9CLOT|nr:dihydroorotase [Clostridium celatum]EKY26168.1 amidohydrolase family protein [Clostridium celatum DSM 1785]MCE9654308.1 dihydroorotase [Clostridium celatum]MDU6295282.1 dihydroorotase [Clostridium celatum]